MYPTVKHALPSYPLSYCMQYTDDNGDDDNDNDDDDDKFSHMYIFSKIIKPFSINELGTQTMQKL